MADAADDDLVDYDDDDLGNEQAGADDKDAKKGHYVGTCVEINECRVHDNSSRSHFTAMTRPRWFRRVVTNRHRRAIEQASRRASVASDGVEVDVVIPDERAVKF